MDPTGRRRTRLARRPSRGDRGRGACAVAFATVVTQGFVLKKRLAKTTGGDFYAMLPAGTDDEERFVRLEISGIGAGGSRSEHQTRLRDKLAQLDRGGDSPGIAMVVAFEAAAVYQAELE